MPSIFEYHCDACDFEMPDGTGTYMYVRAKICSGCGDVVHEIEDRCGGCGTPTDEVEADGYERITCPHPRELSVLNQVLGEDPPEEKRQERVGFHSHCVCPECLSQFDLDTGRDDRRCPECGSSRVKTLLELVDEDCPKCTDGTFVRGRIIGVS